jgi:hypothetical protein
VRPIALIAFVVASISLSISACSGSEATDSSPVSELRQKFPTQLDLANARVRCLNERGWGAKVNDEAQIEATYPSNRQAEYERDNHDCLVKLGADPNAPTPQRLVEKSYPQYKKGAECLREAGWEISEAPSLQQFKETYESAPWFPWAEVPTADMADALTKCPAPEPTY